MSVLYQYQIDGTVHYAGSLQDARKALAKSYRETGTIRMQCVLKRSTVAGFVHPIDGELYWVVNRNGVDMYTKLGDDGIVRGDTTDVPPGETPSFYIQNGPAFKWLETARRYLALYFPKDW